MTTAYPIGNGICSISNWLCLSAAEHEDMAGNHGDYWTDDDDREYEAQERARRWCIVPVVFPR